MVNIIFLGTANAVPDKDHENTHLIIDAGDRVLMVDCSGNPVVRLDQAGIDPLTITDLILSHFHPDHVAGLPLLLMDMWLMGRKDSLNIFGLKDVTDRTVKMMDLYDWRDWDDFYPVAIYPLPNKERMPLINTESLKVWASPLCHVVPSIGMRMAFTEGAICYSSDTAPCESLNRLAEGVDILIHEATGEGPGHTSPEQAGEIAQRAGVTKLVLIHYPPIIDQDEWVRKAMDYFDGEVIIAQDLMVISL